MTRCRQIRHAPPHAALRTVLVGLSRAPAALSRAVRTVLDLGLLLLCLALLRDDDGPDRNGR